MPKASSDDSITLHSSWRGVVGSSVGAAALATAGTFGVVLAGFALIPTVLFTLGWIAVFVMVFDFPIASTFTSHGVTRRMILRRQTFEWADIRQITRSRPNLIRFDRKIEHGGLALLKGRKRYMLVDRSESADEFDLLVELIDVAGVDVGSDLLLRPGERVPPTWLYRTSRWRPDSAQGR